MKTITVRRANAMLHSDRTRVLVRPFRPTSEERAVKICARVRALPPSEVHDALAEILAEFSGRHLKIREYLKRRCADARPYLLTDEKLSEEQELLLGAYFTHEYSLEAAALFNPSIVPHPDQSELPADSLRFILSLRATGEGHISSITFRSGILDGGCNVSISTATRHCLEASPVPNAAYDKNIFKRKLHELELLGDLNEQALQDLPDSFTLEDLRGGLSLAAKVSGDPDSDAVARKTLTLAQSNYEVQFAPDTRVTERVLFPVSPSQSNGIEDARFVRFQNDDGSYIYCATYTAYDGKLILPQFIETPDFLHFRFVTLNGPAVQNKGMALFPRKIGGHYAMLGRQDYENIFLMFSDHLHFWYTRQVLLKPTFPWEFVQLGNCGSPIETDAGWLVISHGVGAMRKYCIGAFLLDRDDPTKVIGRLREPLLKPMETEREGYVPNVVYSCGSLVHRGQLVLPYAMSDYATNFATVPLDELISAME
jgi:predicted GH43/DUF377 family glycosyl hydrolase